MYVHTYAYGVGPYDPTLAAADQPGVQDWYIPYNWRCDRKTGTYISIAYFATIRKLNSICSFVLRLALPPIQFPCFLCICLFLAGLFEE
jgi:hypothetical protein